MHETRQYSDAMLKGMQAAYGDGFLSPGAAADVRRLTAPVEVAGKHVLDLGCGVGGATLMFGGELGARFVTAADPEPAALRQTRDRIERAGIEDRATTVLVEPGPLPFPDDSFDIVYSKDVICHIEDKQALFADLHRVLSERGTVAIGDWMPANTPGRIPLFEAWDAELAAGGLTFHFEPSTLYERALREAGFQKVEVEDVSDIFLAGASEEMAKLQDVEALRQKLGAHGAERRIALTTARHVALDKGELTYVHIRGWK